MPKRKRDEDEERLDSIKDQSIRIKASRLKVRVDQGCVSLTAQLKLARAFDRQKMGRRVRDAQNDAAKLQRLNAELVVLKDLEPSKVAKNQLFKQMVKTKKIRESDPFVAFYGEDAESKVLASKSVAEGNVLGRLFKSKPVSEVLPGILKSIRDVLGIDQPQKAQPASLTTQEIPDEGEALKDSGFSNDEFDGFSSSMSDDEPVSEHKSKADEMEMDESLFETYEGRLIASSDADTENSDSLVGEQSHSRLDSMSITTEEDNDDNDGEEDNEDFEGDDNHDEVERSLPPTTKMLKKQTLSTTAPSADTSFLPSLLMGGYYSGSESGDDVPSFDPDLDYKTHQQVRKNRRGQRERQKIAEKKFGSRAKHLQKQSVQDRSNAVRRDDGWDARRGATADTNGKMTVSRFERFKADRKAGATRQASTGANADPVKPRSKSFSKNKKEASAAVHPSWEAAKKRKQENKIGVGSFQGKKITFD